MFHLLILLALFVESARTSPTTLSLTAIQYPNAPATSVAGINNSGQIVGSYSVASSGGYQTFGFLLSSGSYTQIMVPGSLNTYAYGINNAGAIVGTYYQTATICHGFLLVANALKSIDFPGSTCSAASGINDSNQIVGWYSDNNGQSHGFLLSGGTFTSIDPPLSTQVTARKINNSGLVLGDYVVANRAGYGFYLFKDGTYSNVNVPGILSVRGMNNKGEIVGECAVGSAYDGYVSNGTLFNTFTAGSSSSPMQLMDINDYGQVIGSSYELGEFLATLPGSQGRIGILSHVAAGGGWTTVATLVNTSASAVPVTVALRNDDGSALNLPVTTTQQGTSQTTTASSVSATINPNATLLLSVGGQPGNTVVGWADVSSTGPLGGYAIFRQTPQTGSPSEGTVPLQSTFPSTVTLPYDNTAGFVMGVALANLSTSFANVTAMMWDDSGNLLGTQIITIAGSGHTAFVLPTQLSLTTGRRGIVQFQSAATGGLTGLGLRFSPFGTFTSVPTL